MCPKGQSFYQYTIVTNVQILVSWSLRWLVSQLATRSSCSLTDQLISWSVCPSVSQSCLVSQTGIQSVS
jgi:hypothetical protein